MRQNILFYCIENTTRSQMAEGMGRHFLGHQANVSSAGSNPSDRVHPMAIAVMAEIGIDISHNKPKHITEVEIDEYDLLVSFSEDTEKLNLPASLKVKMWEMSDPGTSQVRPEDLIKKFRKVRDDIRKKVLSLRAAEQVW